MKIKRRYKIRNVIAYLITAAFLIGVSFYLRGFYFKSKTISVCTCANSGILKEAKKQMPDFDYIICMDNMKLIGLNDKTAQLIGYSADEMLGLKNYEFLDEYYKNVFLLEVLERIVKHEGEWTIVVPTKDKRKLLVEVNYHLFEYENGGYMVGKIINSVEIADEEATEYYSN